jgi:hypothetical protein
MHKFLFYNKFIKFLYMFRALCAPHQEVKMYYTASGIVTPVGGRPVHRLREDLWRDGTDVTIPDAVQYHFDLLMMNTQCSKQVEAYNKLNTKQ